MTVTAYKAIDGATIDSLNNKIATAIAGGFQPFGNPSFSTQSNRYVQAMIQGTIDTGGGGAGATVANGATVAVRDSSGGDSHNATAVVTGTTLTGVNLASTAAIVDNTDSISVVNSAGSSVNGQHNIVVNSGAVSVRLASSVAPVTNGQTVNGVTGSGTTATISVANGVITGIVLS